jgi:hypothetical protein
VQGPFAAVVAINLPPLYHYAAVQSTLAMGTLRFWKPETRACASHPTLS